MTDPIKLKFWCNDHHFVEAGFGEPITEVHFNQRGELGLACPLCHKSRPMTIVRWTGLTDKNGSEIYEGDILQYFAPAGDEPIRSVVRWSESMLCWDMTNEAASLYDVDSWFNEIEVIGNTHENPELLGAAS